MFYYRNRIRNRLLQAFYRPRRSRGGIFSASAFDALDEIDKSIEKSITPLLSEFFI